MTPSGKDGKTPEAPHKARLVVYMAGVSLAALVPLQAITINAREISQNVVAVLSPAAIPHLLAVLPPPPIPFFTTVVKKQGIKIPTVVTTPTTIPAPTTTTTLGVPSVAITQGSLLNVNLVPGQTVMQAMQIANTGGTPISQLSFGVIGNSGVLSNVVLQLTACDSSAWTTEAQAASNYCTQPSQSNSASISTLETGNLLLNVAGLTPGNPIWVELAIELPASATNSTSNQRVQLQDVIGVSAQ